MLALVGGVTYAVGSLSGGGDQPADALPAGAFAAVSFDLDPSAGQKVDGFRFLRKFPALRDKVPLDGDLREILFDALAPRSAGTTSTSTPTSRRGWASGSPSRRTRRRTTPPTTTRRRPRSWRCR